MKINKINRLMTAVMLAGAPLLWSACTDTWNEHFNVIPGGMADQPTLLENIKADAELSQFYQVIEGIEATELFSSPQQFTVWAPKTLTAAEKDSIIALYEEEKAQGKKWEDNKAVTQFLQNHMALYARSVSALTEDTVTMRNMKYMRFVGKDDKSGTINGTDFDGMKLSSNGILYKVNGVLPFLPNVREYTENCGMMEGLTAFFKQYDEYELDINASTPGGIVDGKVVYLDSVTTLYNKIINSYGFIEREDSSYLVLAPNDDVWNKEFERYKKYFVYNQSVPESQRDSLSLVNTQNAIMCGRFFNVSPNWRYNRAFNLNRENPNSRDSLCNTYYYEQQQHYPRKNVYYSPKQTILNGLKSFQCSNGEVFVDDRGVIDPKTTFLTRKDIEAQYAFYYEIPKDKNNIPTMTVDTRTYEVYDTTYVMDPETGAPALDPETGEKEVSSVTLKKRYQYANVVAKTANAHSEIEYKIQGTLSNIYYNVYVVTCPERKTAFNNPLPIWFQIQRSIQNEKGTFGSKSYFDNPHPITADSEVANADVILKQGNNKRCFVTSDNKVDTILVAKALMFDYCGNGVDGGICKFTVSSFGPNGTAYREKIYTRTLRLNEIILVPFETKEEAEAAADDLDAFNDEKLQALKEN